MERGVAVADQSHLFALKERPVANGAVGNALPGEFLFLRKIDVFVLYARGDHDRFALELLPVFGHDDKMPFALFDDLFHFAEFKIRPKVGNLLENFVGKFQSTDDFVGGEILHARRRGDLPADGFLFKNFYRFSVP